MKALLICSGGMSTHILISSLEKEAKKLEANFSADAIGLNEMHDYEQDYDVILVAPQIKHRFDEIKEFAEEKNKKIYQIQMTEYTPIGAPKLIQNVLAMAEVEND